jgi:hypothetical protein
MLSKVTLEKESNSRRKLTQIAVPFTTLTTRKWAVLTSKIDKLFIGIGINIHDWVFRIEAISYNI